MNVNLLLTREAFREAVFTRDNHKCVNCEEPAVDAYHIMERRLWDDGGYYLDNGASLCSVCHLLAESTVLSCEEIRLKAGINKILLPPHLSRDLRWDKWGNPYNQDGTRSRGELFYDKSVQKILRKGKVLDNFRKYTKYPRTYHLPWSPGRTRDDRVMSNTEQLVNAKEVVITEKMDGENTTLYSDYIHSRSIDSERHPSQSWVRNFWAKMRWEIPDGWRLCGENLYAKHSIYYNNLPGYFLLFSVWNEKNECLSWKDTVEIATMLRIPLIPILYIGPYDKRVIDRLNTFILGNTILTSKLQEKTTKIAESSNNFEDPTNIDRQEENTNQHEGYVIRDSNKFPMSEFSSRVGKFVRPGHVESSHHWRYENMIINKLKTPEEL